MAAENRIVTVVIVEGIMIEVISCERGGTEFYFWRTSSEDKILVTNASLWPTVEEALEKAMEHVLPDVGIRMLPEPDADDFERLALLLLWDTPMGPIKTMWEAVQWHDTLVDGTAKLEAAEAAARQQFADIRAFLASSPDASDDLCQAANLLNEIMMKQFQLANHCNEREIMILASFIENFIGKRG